MLHNQRMLSTRLTYALSLLALIAILEGLAALWALNVAGRHLERGRVAGDIQRGFIELSATKQRLRTWVSQRQLDAGADPFERDRLLGSMRGHVAQLKQLAQLASTLDNAANSRIEHVQREDVLAVLARSIDVFRLEVESVQPINPDSDPRATWEALSQRFDVSDGRDLRELLEQSNAREAKAVAREREATNSALNWMRKLWTVAASSLALGALLLAAYITHALRKPLQRLSDGAQALQRGDLNHRISEKGNNEFAAVAHSVNAMASELVLRRADEARARAHLEDQVNTRTSELQDALQTLRDVDIRRRQLFADISHELRTPTTAIRGEAEITLRGRSKPAEEYQAALSRIVDSASQLGLVIDDLLTMARSDIDVLSLNRQPMLLAQPLNEALEQARALARQRQIAIDCEPVDESLTVLADGQRLRQLFGLLFDNAICYSAVGGLVTVRVLTLSCSESRVQIKLNHHGAQLSDAELSRVFERHFRGEQARQQRSEGIGLGLPIGAAIARAHGGQIQLVSDPDHGTTAIVTLPLIQTEDVHLT